MGLKRRFKFFVGFIAFLLLALSFLAKGYWNATRDPIIRQASVTLPDWPRGAPPISVLLLSDIHVQGPDMPPERLTKLVEGFNALKPDLVLIAGDLVSEKRYGTHNYTPAEIVAPLGTLKARLGVIVAPGNHDHWFRPNALRKELEAVGLTVLQNEAVQRGPLVIGGVDDDYSSHDDVQATYAAMAKLPTGPRILVTHSPDIVPDLPAPVAAVFAGHTHCGQISFPFYGPVANVSRYGTRFECGDISDKRKDGKIQRVFVGAGLGTSVLPLRYGVPPDAWLVRLGE